jgi:flagellar motility protein MotE (MotC chaperone)
MPKKNDSKNSSNSTKRQRFGTSLRLFRLCKLLALAVVFKLVILATLALDLTGWQIPFLSAPSGSVAQVANAPAASGLPVSAAVAASQAMAASPAFAANATAPAQPAQDSLTWESLQQKQDELNRREQELNRLQNELDQKIQNLQSLETRLQTMLKDAEDAKDKKMRHLVDVYSNMKAKQAAEVLSSLDEGIAVRILAGMRGRQAGEILTFVKPDKAARLSEALTRMQLPFE